jgi:hypothetical protein
MEKIDTILENLRKQIPFALARFNDGEMQGIAQPGCTVARGDQFVTPELSHALKEALVYEQDNYWVGLPCSVCFPGLSQLARSLVNLDYEYLTHAVVITNRNWMKFKEAFPSTIGERKVVWISGDDQKFEKLGFPVHISCQLKPQDSWDQYQETKELYQDMPEGAIVILSCGPLSRVLAREWFEKRPDVTFIDAGSTWDPYTRDVWHRCHLHILPPCSECN